MSTITLSFVDVLTGLGVLFAFLMVWRSGARRARAAADTARSGARLMSLAGRVLFNAAFIVAVQWIIIARSTDKCLLLAVLALPALLASYAATRALTVTTTDAPRRRGDRR